MCADDAPKIREFLERVKTFQDADSAEDASKNAHDRTVGRPAPDVRRAANREAVNAILPTLNSWKALQQLVTGIASHLGCQVHTDSRHLGPALSVHAQYLHRTHEFHTDVPPGVDPAVLELPKTATHMFPTTFVLYLTEAEQPHVAGGMGATSIAPKGHAGAAWADDTRVASCELRSCSVSMFPGSTMHSVAPNPGYERATIAYKVVYHGDREITWNSVLQAAQSVGASIVADMVPSVHPYKDVIAAANGMAAMNVDGVNVNPFNESGWQASGTN